MKNKVILTILALSVVGTGLASDKSSSSSSSSTGSASTSATAAASASSSAPAMNTDVTEISGATTPALVGAAVQQNIAAGTSAYPTLRPQTVEEMQRAAAEIAEESKRNPDSVWPGF